MDARAAVLRRGLIGAAGVGLAGSAAFRTDLVSGYSPGTAGGLPEPSRVGVVHNLAAVPVYVGLPTAALACSWRSLRAGRRGFGLYCVGTAMVMPAAITLASAGFGQSRRLVNLAGLFQRAGIACGFAWLTALSVRALWLMPANGAARPPAT